jgi:hypothetical protein
MMAQLSHPEGNEAVAEATEFTIGAKANCSDGACGEVSRFRCTEPAVYYFKVDDGDVLKLIAPSGGLVYVSYGDKELTNRLADHAPVKQLWFVPVINNVIDAGEQAEVGLSVICEDQGSTKIVSWFYAKVDQDSLFPSGCTGNHHTDVEVE